jgi:hypothetical protein
MKKLSLVMGCAVCFFILSIGLASAHPPKSVALSWNPSSGTLSVNVSHAANDPEKHYVHRIIVYVNNNRAAQKDYDSQSNADGLTDTFSLGALPSGANIKAEAFCVIMGSTTGSLTVP